MIGIDMKMPKSCEDCPIPYITDDLELKCPFQKLYVTGLSERAKGCPLKNERKCQECANFNSVYCKIWGHIKYPNERAKVCTTFKRS